jgi:acyl-CoA thioesterase FadM
MNLIINNHRHIKLLFCLVLFAFMLPDILNFVDFVDYERTWQRSFQKRVVCTIRYLQVCINQKRVVCTSRYLQVCINHKRVVCTSRYLQVCINHKRVVCTSRYLQVCINQKRVVCTNRYLQVCNNHSAHDTFVIDTYL